jgi:hypothetical protein
LIISSYLPRKEYELSSTKLATPEAAQLRVLRASTITTSSTSISNNYNIAMAQREAQIELAIKAIRTNRVASFRAAQRAYGIPDSTLRARLNGSMNRRAAHEHLKRLAKRQEAFLVDWILEKDA